MNLAGRLLHIAWGWRSWRDDLGNDRLGGRRGLIIGNAWLLLVCSVDSRSRGVTKSHGGTIRRWLVAGGLALHVWFRMI